MMRVMLEEQYEEYLNPGRAMLLRKNRKTLHQLDQLQAKLNHYSTNTIDPELSEEEKRLQDMVGHGHHVTNGFNHDTILPNAKETCDAECQTVITGEISSVKEQGVVP